MIEARVRGIPDLKAALAGIVPKLRVRALRNALAAGARVVQRAAVAKLALKRTDGIAMGDAIRKGYRKHGTVAKAISVRTSKLARRAGDVGVFVNVRPAKGSNIGAKNPNDPFYWRFINWGTKARVKGERSMGIVRGKMKSRRHNRSTGATRAILFLEAGAARLPQALDAFIKSIGPQIAKLNKPKAPAP